MTTPSLSKHYSDAVQYLDDEFAFFLTHVLNIGKPEAVGNPPTAAVAVDPKSENIGADFRFLFNPSFASTLSTEDMAFVMAHETMHVLLNHLSLNKKFKDKKRFNVAADCVINDYLADMGLTPPDMALRGDEQVGYNCAHATVTEVYGDVGSSCDGCDGTGVGEDGEKCDQCDGTGDSGAQGDGAYGGYADGGRALDDHEWMEDSTEGDAEAAEKQVEDAVGNDLEDKKNKESGEGGGVSPSGVGGAQGFSELKGVGIKWAELLKKINPFVFNEGPRPRPAWHRKPRKLMGDAYRDIYLPVTNEGTKGEGGEMPALVMALDTSGSIGQETANKFVNFARSVPQDQIKLHVCTFTSQYMELDLDDPKWVSGGTNFSAVENYIQDVVKDQTKGQYPKSVVVVTDGAADFYGADPEERDPWLFLIEGSANYLSTYCSNPPGESDKLDNYIWKGGRR
jgi:predicted metal-dependent peptidase